MKYSIYYAEDSSTEFSPLWPDENCTDLNTIDADELQQLIQSLNLKWDDARCYYVGEDGPSKGCWKFVLHKEEGPEHE